MVGYYTRINDKHDELNKFLLELGAIIPETISEYEKDYVIRAACERYFEKISEIIFEICKLIIKDQGVTVKTNEFETLFKLEIINLDLMNKLKKIKGMRNIIVHQYGELNDLLMFDSLKGEILKDAKEFSQSINLKFNNS